MGEINKMGKVEENKEEKKQKILDSAFKLFTTKSVKETSVQDIATDAGIAKGTFYLYFKDKYDVQDYLIAKKSRQLLSKAVAHVKKQKYSKFEDKLIAVIDYIIDEFCRNKLLLKFISKNLSYGLYSDKVALFIDDSSIGLVKLFKEEMSKSRIEIENPEITLFMIIEFVSSTAFSSITSNKPLPIKEFKPYLYKNIKRMIS